MILSPTMFCVFLTLFGPLKTAVFKSRFTDCFSCTFNRWKCSSMLTLAFFKISDLISFYDAFSRHLLQIPIPSTLAELLSPNLFSSALRSKLAIVTSVKINFCCIMPSKNFRCVWNVCIRFILFSMGTISNWGSDLFKSPSTKFLSSPLIKSAVSWSSFSWR